MSREALQVLTLLESAYRVDVSDTEWMRDLLQRGQALFDRGLGLSGYFVDASSPDGFVAWGFDCVGMDRDVEAERFRMWYEHAPATLKRHAHLHGAVDFASQLPPGDIARQAFEESFEITGRADVLGISALDGSGIGCALAIPYPDRQTHGPPPATRTLWERTAAHLSSALRLRRGHRRSHPDAGDAVIDPSGRIEHAEGPATSHRSRECLRDAARRFDRARCTGAGLDPIETTEMWQALIAGRWTLIDHFDRDGRRYIIARPNAPAVKPVRALTAREAQVLRAAALGHSNKLIAYELGIAPSTVSLCLRRAAQKLGAKNRLELIRICAAQGETGRPAPPARGEN